MKRIEKIYKDKPDKDKLLRIADKMCSEKRDGPVHACLGNCLDCFFDYLDEEVEVLEEPEHE